MAGGVSGRTRLRRFDQTPRMMALPRYLATGTGCWMYMWRSSLRDTSTAYLPNLTGSAMRRIFPTPPARQWSGALAGPFDHDSKGRFHLLVATSAGRLYYFCQQRGPALIASGEERFFPVVIARARVYLGCYRSDHGYRFLEFDRYKWGSKIVDYEG